MKVVALNIPARVRSVRWDFVAGGVALALLILIANLQPIRPLASVLLTLTGRSVHSDLAQDLYGFRALWTRANPYPRIDQAAAALGQSWGDWGSTISSTHPPTAFLLTALVAWLPWPIASALWAWLMVAALGLALRTLKLPLYWLVPVLLWPPAAFSLGQLTPIWLLGAVLAEKHKDKPLTTGIWIGVASLPKFFPALLLIPFLLERKWKALLGFGLVWFASLAIVWLLHPGAIPQYLEVNRANSALLVTSAENGALLPWLWKWLGWPGALLGLWALVALGVRGRQNWRTFEYLSVVLLPLTWIYSLLPLLPGMIRNLKSWMVWAAIAVTFITPPFGDVFPYFSVAVLLLLGIDVYTCRIKSKDAITIFDPPHTETQTPA